MVQVTEAMVGPGKGCVGPLVGRERECDILELALERLARGPSQVIEVTGDPGIGKTRLLGELSRRAAERGFLVLDGRARHAGERIPFCAVVDALDDRLAGLGDDADVAALSWIFPSLRGPGAGSVTIAESGNGVPARESANGAVARRPGNGAKARESGAATAVAPEPYRLFRAVRALLESLATRELVLLIDDLQWADEDTTRLLAQLIRRPPRRPVMLAMAYRWRQAPTRLRSAAAAAGGENHAAFLRLGPLSEAEAEVMLAGRGSRSWRRVVYQASGGNPFYLDALARSVGGRRHPADGGQGYPGYGGPGYSGEGGLGTPDDRRSPGGEGSDALPPAVTAALLSELAALSPDGRLAASSAAVIGDPFCVMSVGEVSGLDERRAAAAVAELTAADLIRPVDPTRLFRFRHALVRSVTYQDANPAWRIGAHSRTATALRHCGAPLTAQAHHIERAAELGDLGAVHQLAEAAATVQAQAPGTAAQWLRAALRMLPEETGPEQERTALLLRLAFALGAAGNPAESRDMLHAALRRLSAQRRDSRVEAVAFCAQMERQLGRSAGARALLMAELAALDEQETALAATLQFELGCGELAAGDFRAAREWARRALAAAEGSVGQRAAVLGLLAVTDAICGDIADATAHRTAGATLLDGMLDGELAQHLDAALWVGWGELFLERPTSALRYLDRALALAHDNGQVLAVAALLTGRVVALQTTGELAEAVAAAEEAAEAAMLTGSGEQQAAALALRCNLAAWTGDIKAAAAPATAAADRLPGPSSARGWLAVLAARALAEARLAMGDPEGCIAVSASAIVSAQPETDSWPWAPAGWNEPAAWYELLTRAELAGGHRSAAARWAQAAADAASRANLPGHTGLALLAQAQVVMLTDPRAGYELAVTACDALSVAGMILDSARASLTAAAALGACGNADQACAEARAAQSVFQSCGAAPFARSAAALRRRIMARGSNGSHGPAGNGASSAPTLTRRQQQVAALLSEGMSNRRIAQQLHVTDKTVEMHLSNIFARLGVSSRTEAAAALVRAGRT
jgi:DNA-binding NarL/FixJ family response regulator